MDRILNFLKWTVVGFWGLFFFIFTMFLFFGEGATIFFEALPVFKNMVDSQGDFSFEVLTTRWSIVMIPLSIAVFIAIKFYNRSLLKYLPPEEVERITAKKEEVLNQDPVQTSVPAPKKSGTVTLGITKMRVKR